MSTPVVRRCSPRARRRRLRRGPAPRLPAEGRPRTRRLATDRWSLAELLHGRALAGAADRRARRGVSFTELAEGGGHVEQTTDACSSPQASLSYSSPRNASGFRPCDTAARVSRPPSAAAGSDWKPAMSAMAAPVTSNGPARNTSSQQEDTQLTPAGDAGEDSTQLSGLRHAPRIPPTSCAREDNARRCPPQRRARVAVAPREVVPLGREQLEHQIGWHGYVSCLLGPRDREKLERSAE